MILVDPAAKKAALEIQEATPAYSNLYLRIYLAGKGCDGFNYGVSFDEKIEGDIEIDLEGLKLVVDEKTLPFVKGSSLEWVDDERGKGFVVSNPNHRKFRGKFFKKKNWQESLPQ